MNREDAVKTLIDLGLGKGEAKTYVTLVLSGRAEASPLANLAGVPQPKIYEYLKNLINKGFVKQYATSGRAKLYEAISPKIVVSILQNKIEEKSKETIEFFENSKQSINLKEPALDVSVGRENVMIRLEDMIANAKRNVFFIPSFNYRKEILMFAKKYNQIDYYSIKISNELMNKLLNIFEIKSEYLSSLKTLYPLFISTDVDFDRKTCYQTAILAPQTHIEDSFMIVFHDSFIPLFQFNVIMGILSLTDEIKIEKLEIN